jgi:hypothetical protein
MKKFFVSLLIFSLSCVAAASSPTANDISALWHLDGDYYETMGTGSISLGWYGEHFSDVISKVGTGAADCAGGENSRGRIQLAGDAQLGGLTQFGIAFWGYRVNNRNAYGSVLSFGTGMMEIEHVGPGNDESWFFVKNAGFCTFNGQWNHSIYLPQNQWTHVAITADGTTGRIIVDGVLKWSYPQTGQGLNAGTILNLGCETPVAGGRIDCYLDEIVFTNKPSNEAWAQVIYEATAQGKNLLMPSDCEDVIRLGLLFDGDINADCYVNMTDLALMVSYWLQCNDPEDENCVD